MPLMDAGPVTLGVRLSCSPFPTGYAAISYGRGTWLFHMLRTMTRDAESKRTGHRASARENLDEPFLRALRKLRERYQGKSISTRDVLRVFEEELPPSLWYEGQKSLDWFYNGWINGTAIPRLELHDVKYVERDGSTRISGTIRQSEAPADLVTLVPVYGTVGGKSVAPRTGLRRWTGNRISPDRTHGHTKGRPRSEPHPAGSHSIGAIPPLRLIFPSDSALLPAVADAFSRK